MITLINVTILDIYTNNYTTIYSIYKVRVTLFYPQKIWQSA